MSLTIGSYPTKGQTNYPYFSVSTSLTEGAGYQNLRVRATVYIAGQNSGEPVAVLQQAKGLNNWNFDKLLKRYIGRCSAPVGGTDYFIAPTQSAQIITSWTNYGSGYSTFASTANAITSCVGSGDALSNNFTGSKGDLYALINSYLTATGLQIYPMLTDASGNILHVNNYADISSSKIQSKKIYYFLLTDDTYAAGTCIDLKGTTVTALSGNFELRKVTDFKGDPAVWFKVVFQEVYENASDVTTIGVSSESDTILYVPAELKDSENFDNDYLAAAADTMSFLSRGVQAAYLQKYKFGIGMEKRFLAIYNEGYQVQWMVGGEYDTGEPAIGWAILISNDNQTGLDAADTSYNISITDGTWTLQATVQCQTKCYKDMKCLSFVGDLGEETILFNGPLTRTGSTEKAFYKKQDGTRRNLLSLKKRTTILRTNHEDESSTELLFELINTLKQVWLFDEGSTGNYIDVGVITDSIKLYDKNQLIDNEIEIEYNE